MVAIPQNPKTTVAEIYRHYEINSGDGFRQHLGASLIGRPCRRALWYTFRWCRQSAHAGRVLRLFERGQSEEAVFVQNLRDVGCKVLDIDPQTGRQFTHADIGGHFGGSMDAVILGLVEAPRTWHVGEFKTHGDKSFKTLQKDGVQKSKPEHFDQMQLYMHWSGLERAYYLAVNKNDDSLYGERVYYDKAHAERLIEKAAAIINAPEPLERISEDPAWYQCKWCDYRGICHGDEGAAVNCRTCAHSTPETDGDARWSCAYWQSDIPAEAQREGCQHHLMIPALVNWATQVDASAEENWIEYETPTGKRYRNGDGYYSSMEFSVLNAETIEQVEQDAAIGELREMGGEVIKYEHAS